MCVVVEMGNPWTECHDQRTVQSPRVGCRDGARLLGQRIYVVIRRLEGDLGAHHAVAMCARKEHRKCGGALEVSALRSEVVDGQQAEFGARDAVRAMSHASYLAANNREDARPVAAGRHGEGAGQLPPSVELDGAHGIVFRPTTPPETTVRVTREC